MGFWWFMLVMDLLVPITMIGFGRYFSRRAPKKMNLAFGYRTSRSMKNQETWEFAHKHIGKMWSRIGVMLIPVTLIPMCLVIGQTDSVVGTVGGVVNGIQVVALCASIIPTENALKKQFDENGNRR